MNETFNTALSISADAISRKKAYKRSLKLMDKQYAMDERAWQRVQDYNTPMMQMKRLKEAGLNPALMYGQGNTGNAQQQIQSKFNELEPFTSGATIASSTAAGVQLSMANAQKEKIKSESILNAIRGANETKQVGIAQDLAKSNVEYNTAKIRGLDQQVEESKDRILTGKATREQIRSAIANDSMQRMKIFADINLTNAQIGQVRAATNQVLTDTALTKRIIALDYSGKYGKNTAENIRKLATDIHENELIGAATLLGSAALLRNPAAIGRIGGSAAVILRKNSKKLNEVYKQVKSYIKWKFGMKGWLNN
jgi:hypothetical protein